MTKIMFLLKSSNGEWTPSVTVSVPVGDGKQEKGGKSTAYEAGVSMGTRTAEEGRVTPRPARVGGMRGPQRG